MEFWDTITLFTYSERRWRKEKQRDRGYSERKEKIEEREAHSPSTELRNLNLNQIELLDRYSLKKKGKTKEKTWTCTFSHSWTLWIKERRKINETELLNLSEFSLPFKKEGQDEWDGPGSQDGIGKTIDSWSWPYLFFVKQRLHWF